jgi:hypothetical protein
MSAILLAKLDRAERLDGMKSTVPAMVVLSPSVGNRRMLRIPDWPAVETRPVVTLADAERGENADSGDGHGGVGLP